MTSEYGNTGVGGGLLGLLLSSPSGSTLSSLAKVKSGTGANTQVGGGFDISKLTPQQLAALGLGNELSPKDSITSVLNLLELIQSRRTAEASAAATPATPSIAGLLQSLASPGQEFNQGFEPGGLADVLSGQITGTGRSTVTNDQRQVNRVPVSSLMGSPAGKVAPGGDLGTDITAAQGLLQMLTGGNKAAIQPAPTSTFDKVLDLAKPLIKKEAAEIAPSLSQAGQLPDLNRSLKPRAEGGIDQGGTMLHVGEGEAPSDEFVYLPPGSTAVVAPREEGDQANMQGAVQAIMRMLGQGGKPQKKGVQKAQDGGLFGGMEAIGGDPLQYLLALIKGAETTNRNNDILAFSRQLGRINPGAFGLTNPADTRNALMGGEPTLEAQLAMMANALDERKLGIMASEGAADRGLKSRAIDADLQNAAAERSLKQQAIQQEGALGNRKLDLDARQLLSTRATRQLAGPSGAGGSFGNVFGAM